MTHTVNNIVFNWPQITILVVYFLALVGTITKGNVYSSLRDTVVVFAMVWVLYQGGFFHQGVC